MREGAQRRSRRAKKRTLVKLLQDVLAINERDDAVQEEVLLQQRLSGWSAYGSREPRGLTSWKNALAKVGSERPGDGLHSARRRPGGEENRTVCFNDDVVEAILM